MNRTLLEVEKKLNEILSEQDEKIKVFKEKIKQAEEQKKEADRELINAKENLDPDEYFEIEENIRRADVLINAYNSKLEQKIRTPLITAEEYKRLKANINKTMKSEIDDVKAKSFKAIQELEHFRDFIDEDINKTNELLEKLQRKVYKAGDKERMADGTTWAIQDDSFHCDDILVGLNNIIDNYFYQVTLRRES